MPDNTLSEYRYLGQPELASLLNFLQITCHMPEQAALVYPLGLARMRRLAWLESEGQARITNFVDAEVAKAKEKYMREHPEPEIEICPA